MAIEKLRHGAEITSTKLNEIISILNNNEKSHQEIRDLAQKIEDFIKEDYLKYEKFAETISEKLNDIPEIKNLYADILLSRDTVDWIDLSEDITDINAFIYKALSEESEGSQTAHRLKIIRGTAEQINKVERKDKQVLVSYEPNSSKGILYFDCYNAEATKKYREEHPEDHTKEIINRIPVSSNVDTTISVDTPSIEFLSENGEEYVLFKYESTGQTFKSPNIKGLPGSAGAQGPQGPQGIQGPKGDIGPEGIQGPSGNNGSTTLISIWFSDYSNGMNATETYNNHKYMGIKTYLDTDTQDTIKATPIKWFRISGDTMYPVYNPKTGYLTFTTIKPAESSFYIKGDKGDTGPAGSAPKIGFKLEDGTIKYLEAISSEGEYIYDASMFTGKAGPAGPQGKQGEQGPEGKAPKIRFIAELSDDQTTSIKNTTPIDVDYVQYTIQVPRGKDGTTITGSYMNDGKVYLIKNDGDSIPLGQLKGEKGEKGDPGTIAIKGAFQDKNELPVTGITVGDAYVVQSVVDNENVSNLYVCVDINGTSIDEIYTNIGNIKGEKGDTGKDGVDGATIYSGTAVSQPGNNILVEGIEFKVGDYYINTSTMIMYKITRAQDSVYNIATVGSIKGEKGDQGDQGPIGPTGKGINAITLISQQDNEDTYSIQFTDQSTTEFKVKHGKDGIAQDGKDGTMIYNGDTNPSITLGNIGDFYLNNTTSEFYKKINDTTWEVQTLLKGTDGQDASRGPQINTLPENSAIPSSTTGFILGDMILMLGTYDLYQVTGSAENKNWSNVGNLKGVVGPQGPAGSYTKANKIVNTDAEVNITMNQSTYYQLTNSQITDIQLNLHPVEEGTVGEFIVEFSTGSIVPFITLPEGVRYANGWSIDDYIPNTTYVIYIIDTIAYVSYT